MRTKGALTAVGAILQFVIVLPIWYYLLYKILVAVNASDLMWFLYFAYLPVGVITTIISKLIEQAK